jgi:hypothetical protein
MTNPKLLQLTSEDKLDYLEKIKKVDINRKNMILKILGPKIESMIKKGNLNSVEIILIDDIAKLIGILELYPDLPTNMVKKILFALTYFIDENDEIPDIIPNYGYLDDIKVVEWVLDDVRDQIDHMPRA